MAATQRRFDEKTINGHTFWTVQVPAKKSHHGVRTIYYMDGKRHSMEGWYEDRRACQDAEWARGTPEGWGAAGR